ncbi:MAG: hypothetical protein DMF62_01720 [Acidobacteria bacterium]|nr:MAG: hypothetical protein DMF62_01720 [Acidobacteriota bacterium]
MRKPHVITGILIAIAAICWWTGFCIDNRVEAQTERSGVFRIGERLTYSISFDKFQNVAYAETYVVSKGKFNGKAAIEIQSKLKTLNFVTVGVMLLDAHRTALVSPTDGSVLFVKNVDKSAGIPIETTTNVTERAPGSFDLSSIIYKIRSTGGGGSFTMLENEKVYSVSFQTVGAETVRSDAGEFPANIVEVKSDYLVEFGITGLRISISTEESSVPVQFRVRTARGEFRALIASIQLDGPEPTPTPGSTPSNAARPTPRPSSTPAPYFDNQPLKGMPFGLGETLAYSVSSGPRQLGTIVLSAKERVLVNKKDSLVLTATVINENGGLFRVGNGIRSNVDPETLSPFDLSVKFDGPLESINRSVKFDPTSSKVILPSGESIDVPVGTQNILSLVYAIRLFNLEPSKDTTNPVNDTRVAVYWEGKAANIFTLKPSDQAVLTIGNAKVPAQPISMTTRIPTLDALEIKVWLSVDERRVPLRIVVGSYRLDLQIPNLVPQP